MLVSSCYCSRFSGLRFSEGYEVLQAWVLVTKKNEEAKNALTLDLTPVFSYLFHGKKLFPCPGFPPLARIPYIYIYIYILCTYTDIGAVCETRRTGMGFIPILPTVLGSKAGTGQPHDLDSMSLEQLDYSSIQYA